MVDYDADELLKTGWRLIADTEREMHEVAKRIDPSKSVKGLLEESKKNHPNATGLLDAYRENMQAARQFVIDHEIATCRKVSASASSPPRILSATSSPMRPTCHPVF
jgi:hypothetical protein